MRSLCENCMKVGKVVFSFAAAILVMYGTIYLYYGEGDCYNLFPVSVFSLFAAVIIAYGIYRFSNTLLKKNIMVFVYCWFLMITELFGTGMKILTLGEEFSFSAPRCFAIISLAFFYAMPVSYFTRGAVGYFSQLFCKGKNCKKCKESIFFCVWGVIFIAWIPCFLAYYPGILGYDAPVQWRQYMGEVGFSTHHPLIHTLLLGGILDWGFIITGSYNVGLVVYSLLSLLIMSGCVSYALMFMIREKMPHLSIAICGLFYIFFPAIPILTISTTKDGIFSALFLLVFVFILEMSKDKRMLKGRKKYFFILSTVLMLLFRKNAVYALMFALLVLLFSGCIKNRLRVGKFYREIAVVLVFCMILAGGCEKVMKEALQASKGSVAETMSVPVQQLARVFNYHESELSEKDIECILAYIPEEHIRDYRYDISDPIKDVLDVQKIKENPLQFLTLWIEMGLKYPGEYVASFTYNTMGLWYIGDISYSTVKNGYLETRFNGMFGEYDVKGDSQLPKLKQFYEEIISQNAYQKVPVVAMMFSPAFYVWILFGILVIILYKRKWNFALPYLYVCSYIVTLFLGPCIVVRYCMPYILCIPILLFSVLDVKRDDDYANVNITNAIRAKS